MLSKFIKKEWIKFIIKYWSILCILTVGITVIQLSYIVIYKTITGCLGSETVTISIKVNGGYKND